MPHQLFFAVHNHQPVGNFDPVIEAAFQKAYLPFLRLVKKYPAFKFALHNSGILYEWAEKKKPEFFKLIEQLLAQKQLELLGGAFYEPILPAIPEADRIGQISKMSDYLKKRFGQKPTGIWIPERVWEPNLPKSLAEAGIEYTMLDDTHFKHAGYDGSLTEGPLVTEDEGRWTYLFPILKELRYKIPFGTIEEVKNLLFTNPDNPKSWVYADDGEKFGVWPKTYEHCYTNGWLEKFLEAVTSRPEVLELKFFSEPVKNREYCGKIYLPTASYEEMLEWALPPSRQNEYETVIEKLKQSGDWEKAAPFLRGGFWRNFLAKYPEINQMHKKMLFISYRLQAIKNNRGLNRKKWNEAQNLLWKGQCNCPYWHGVFGGAYLNHLRAANYAALIGAQNLLYELENGKPKLIVEETDFDADGRREIIAETPSFFLVIDPHQGGSLTEMDFKSKKFNLQNTFASRPEAYHQKLKESSSPSSEVATIHAKIEAKEKDLEKYLPVTGISNHPNWSFYDKVYVTDKPIRPEQKGSSGVIENNHYETPYRARIKKERKKATISLGLVNSERYSIDKSISLTLERSELIFSYTLRNLSKEEKWHLLESEFNLNFEAPDALDRYFKINGQKPNHPALEVEEQIENVNTVEIIDEWRKLAAIFRFSSPVYFERRPIFTVSLSEAGAEKIYQGSTLLFGFPLHLKPGQSEGVNFKLELLSL